MWYSKGWERVEWATSSGFWFDGKDFKGKDWKVFHADKKWKESRILSNDISLQYTLRFYSAYLPEKSRLAILPHQINTNDVHN